MVYSKNSGSADDDLVETQALWPASRAKPHPSHVGTHHAFQSLCGRHDVEWRGQSLRPLIYGGIICTSVGKEIYYAMVQGRQTGKWSFPKGHANEGEEALKCALREIEEETGLTGLVEEKRICGKVGYGNYFVFILPSMVELKAVDTKEIMTTAWVTVEQMNEMNVNADVMNFLRGSPLVAPRSL